MTVTMLAALKWVAQGLVAIVGVWGLFSEPYKIDPATGRKSLGGVGWLKIGLLCVGFALFVLTDRNETKRAQIEQARQEQQLENQARNLSYVRRLLLLQYRLSYMELSVQLPGPVLERFFRAIGEYRDDRGEVDRSQLEYVSSAYRQGQTRIRYGGQREGELDYWLERPGGTVAESVDASSYQWRAFTTALSSAFGDRFQVRSASGRVLFDLLRPAGAIELGFRDGEIVVSIPEPGIRLDELSEEISFVCGEFQHLSTERWDDEREELVREAERRKVGPDRIRWVSRDPRVTLDRELALEWMPSVVHERRDPDRDEAYAVGRWRSSPCTLEPDLSGLGLDD